MAMTLTIIVLALFCAAEFFYAIYDVWKDERKAKSNRKNKEEK